MKFTFQCTQIILNKDHAAVNGNMSAGEMAPAYAITFAGAVDEILAAFRAGESYPVEFGQAIAPEASK